jgi:hypothetical protein
MTQQTVIESNILMAEIVLRCPGCDRKLKGVPLMTAATLVVKRQCPCKSCQTRWQVKVVPVRSGEGYAIHTADWTYLAKEEE